MALAVVGLAMNLEENDSIHPFFTKPPRVPLSEQKAISNEPLAHDADNNVQDESTNSGADSIKSGKKRGRKQDCTTEKQKDTVEVGQASLNGIAQQVNSGGAGSSYINPESSDVLSMKEDLNFERRKRRKTASPVPSTSARHVVERHLASNRQDWHQQLEQEAEKISSAGGSTSQAPLLGKPDIIDTKEQNSGDNLADSNIRATLSGATLTLGASASKGGSVEHTPPRKKLMKISRSGKLLSSPPSKQESEASNTPRKKRGRGLKQQKPTSIVTVIKYGSTDEARRIIGQKIEIILSGQHLITKQPATPTKAAAKPTGPPKATHPFFLGKVAQKQEEPVAAPAPDARPPRSARKSAVTPGKLKAETNRYLSSSSIPAFGPIAGDNRIARHPGTSDAPWPTKVNSHVRNFAHGSGNYGLTVSSPKTYSGKLKKQKNNVIRVSENDDLLVSCKQELKSPLLAVRGYDGTDYAYSDGFRAPKRLLTTSIDIQERVRTEVKAPVGNHGQAENLLNSSQVHPVLTALYDDIQHILTPFDQGICETQSWVQKYAPSCASHVLQRGKDATVLRDWLANLTVKAVNSGQDHPRTAGAQEAKRQSKKKRRRVAEDFIVPDEEVSDDDLVELSDSEDYGYANMTLPPSRSLRRPRASRNKNVVVVSGPHGCGKTAAVYAVAKELGFEIFEINSGSRRSGKDIQDKVGDMTENHLVNHKRDKGNKEKQQTAAEDTENERMSEAFDKDLQSGRQGTMASFFKIDSQHKNQTISKAQPKRDTKEQLKVSGGLQATLQDAISSRSQKQSLILFEEVDILFEEDQQFWSQVIKLASLSKRPIVITCNDEARVPIYDLPLAAILRMSPAPRELATDYLLLLAAREGHVLKRQAISDLLKSKDCDLRASIMELNFWCQMSVGDRKGGLEWIYQRWPPGKDINEDGHTLRVASEGTYRSGMGFLSHDISKTKTNSCFDREEELLKEAWNDWGAHPEINDIGGRLPDAAVGPDTSTTHVKVLEQLDLMAEYASAADVYCRIGLPTYESPYHEPTDPSLPPMSAKERCNYIEGAPVLQVDHFADFSGFDTSMLIQNHLNIQRSYCNTRISSFSPTKFVNTLSEVDVTRNILEHTEAVRMKKSLSWPDFSHALDLLAAPPATTLALSTSHQLLLSSFDRTFRIVVEDLAPFVRSIVTHELRIEAQRLWLSNLLSEGGTGKRGRTTRASRTALEGGRRETKRRQHWFDKDLNRALVMATAGASWAGLGTIGDETDASSRTEGSLSGTQDSCD